MSEKYEVTVSPFVQVLKIYDKDKGQSSEDRTRYITNMLITDLGLKECRLHLVSGELNEEINKLVYTTIKDLGYKKVQMEVPEGTPSTRFSKYSHTEDGLDRYITEM